MKQILHTFVVLVTMLFGLANYSFAEKYAVIISGEDETRYRNDCSVVYQTLIGKGYGENQIYLAISDGSSLDLNRDVYPATIDQIEYIFNELAYTMTGDDDLFIYVTGPGRRNATTGHSYIKLLGEDSISDAAFTHMLEALQYRTINIVMQQSYSGGFIDDLIGLNNIVITTACNATEEARIKAPYNYVSEFTFRWVSAIINDSPCDMLDCSVCSPISNPHPNHDPDIYINDPYNTECVVADEGDYNWDGYVTMKEAFNYAEHYDQTLEHPQIASNPGCLSRALALNELLYPDDCSPVLIEGWDLYMRDNSADDGTEPNISTNEHWLTPDIWFEENGERVDKLQSGQTYDFCVRVYNRGAETSPAGAVLYAHWTKARIGGSWPWGWTGYTYDCNGTHVRQGDYVGSVTLPSIGGGETYTARIPWTTPESEEFSPCLEFAGDYLNELWHYCVLARIVDSQEQPDETITGMDFQNFVLEFNNVVSRNVTIMGTQDNDHHGTSSIGVVGIANPRPGEDSGPYTLKFDIDRIVDLDHFANVTLTFPSWFYNSHNDMTWQNCHNQGYGNFILADNAQFDNINFTADDNYFYPLVLDVEYYEFNPNFYYVYDINLTLEDASGVLVGGERFRFRNELQGMVNSIRSRDIPVEEENNIGQKPTSPEDILYVDVYNAQGQLIMRIHSDNIESLNLPKGVYILRKVGETQSYSIKIIK